MTERLSNEELSGMVESMANEIDDLRADAETSQNHNAGVIDRIVAQLRDAGYTGTLSEMVDQACELKEFSNYVEGA